MKIEASKTFRLVVAAAVTLARRKLALAACVALCTVGLAFSQSDDEATIITFDAPGAVNATFVSGINPAGAITGFYRDVNFVYHGFLRAPDGAITTLDAPGAGTGFFQGTAASAINPAGAIAGNCTDANFVTHGFLRARDGTFTTFDPAGSTSTSAGTINPEGTVAGGYTDANGVSHGFLRIPHGK